MEETSGLSPSSYPKEEKDIGHLTTKDAYKTLEERVNWFTQGAPPSAALYQICLLYTSYSTAPAEKGKGDREFTLQ